MLSGLLAYKAYSSGTEDGRQEIMQEAILYGYAAYGYDEEGMAVWMWASDAAILEENKLSPGEEKFSYLEGDAPQGIR